ncbi:MAG: hypothetical protein IJ806_04615 [Ruminococcus sp.]|nr:hypothetical protein [Ruminococcus sp.]
MKEESQSRNGGENAKKQFRLSDEARARIDREYSDVSTQWTDKAYERHQRKPGQRRSSAHEVRSVQRAQRQERQQQDRLQSYKARSSVSERYEDCQGYTDYQEDRESPEPKKSRFRHWRRKLAVRILVISAVLMLINVGVLFFSGKLWFNEPRKRDYPIRGPVISEKEGRVDWEKFTSQNIQMVYVRATKSTAYVDERFQKNRSALEDMDIPAGFIHVFDLAMSGSDQAQHFIKSVGKLDNWLLPVVDIEATGFYNVLPVEYDNVRKQLREFCDELIKEYGKAPVIKCDKKIYEKVVGTGFFEDCPLWYISEYTKPDSSIDWTFWGYSSRVKFDYYESGGFLEMTVYKGDETELGYNMFV